MIKKVTISQIAAEVGLAKSTVSCVLNGKANAGVSAARAAQVLEVAKRLNYRPSAAARAMRTGRFNAMGMILSDKADKISPFIEMWRAILDQLHHSGMGLTVGQLPDKDLTNEGFVPRLLGEWAVDGLLVDYVAEMPERMVQLIREHHIPSVWINNRMPFDCVYPDDIDAFRRATRHLLGLGHSKIAYVTFHRAHHYSHADRYAGYEQEMQAAGLTPRAMRSDVTIPREDRLVRARALLAQSDRPTAILTWEMDDAYPFMLAAAHLGLSVPGDLSLMTAHHEPTNELGVMVGHVRLPAVELGREAVKILLAKVATPDTPIPPKALPFTLEPGATTGRPTQP